MTDPQIATVRDKDGLVHSSYRHGKFVVDGLANGSLVEVDEQGNEVVADGASAPSRDSVDPESDKQRVGSADRKPKARAAGSGTDAGEA